MKSSRFAVLAALLFAFVAPGQALAAAGILDGVTTNDCKAQNAPDRVVPPAVVLNRAFSRHGITVTAEMLQPSPNGEAPLRRLANEIIAIGEGATTGDDLKGAAKSKYELYAAARDLTRNLDAPVSGLVDAEIKSTAPVDITERVRQFLAGTASEWLVVRCRRVTPEADTDDEAPTPGRVAAYLAGVRIAKDRDGATEEELGDSNFATVAAKNDQAANEETYAITAYLLGPSVLADGEEFTLQPFIEFQRKDAGAGPKGDINDLTFGLLSQLEFDGAREDGWLPIKHYFDVSLGWETDDSLESSVTRVELVYEPVTGLPGNARQGRCLVLACAWTVALAADYADISNTSGKPALEDLTDFGRIGYDGNVVFYFGPGAQDERKSAWAWTLSADYKLRDTFTEDRADAQYFTGRLAFLPSNTGNFSLGLDYVRGKDLTSLEKEEYWAISIGYRR